MERTETTAALSRLVEQHIRRRCRLWAPEVTLGSGGRVDYMGFQPHGECPDAASIERGTLVCYEIKSCRADFESGHGLNMVGDENWLVCPRELCAELRSAHLLPPTAGVLCPDASWRRLLETIHQPPSAYKYRRRMSAAEAIWRIAKESYGANYSKEVQSRMSEDGMKNGCKYCRGEKHIQLKGGGKYGRVEISRYSGEIDVQDSITFKTLTFKAKRCPMCGRPLGGS